MNRLGVTTLALPRGKKISWGEVVFCLGTFCFPPGASSGHFFLLSSWAKRTPWQHLEENRYYLNTGIHTMLVCRRLVSQPQKQTAQLTLSWPGAGIMEADYRQMTTVFTVQPSFHHRTRQRENHEALPSSANVQSHFTSSFADDGNASWHSICRVPMMEWRMDCKNCRHLTVVSLHDTGSWPGSLYVYQGFWSVTFCQFYWVSVPVPRFWDLSLSASFTESVYLYQGFWSVTFCQFYWVSVPVPKYFDLSLSASFTECTCTKVFWSATFCQFYWVPVPKYFDLSLSTSFTAVPKYFDLPLSVSFTELVYLYQSILICHFLSGLLSVPVPKYFDLSLSASFTELLYLYQSILICHFLPVLLSSYTKVFWSVTFCQFYWVSVPVPK